MNEGNEASYTYSFDGIPPGQVVSLGAPDADADRPHVG